MHKDEFLRSIHVKINLFSNILIYPLILYAVCIKIYSVFYILVNYFAFAVRQCGNGELYGY